MGQTLTHGIYLPDEGERNCYDGLAGNWQILDGSVGTIAEHTAALAGKAPLVHTHTKSDITDLFNSANTWTNSNTYSKAITVEKNSDTDFFFNTKHTAAELGSLPSSDQSITWAFKDKNDDNLCYARVYYETTGGNSFRIFVRNKFTSGAPSTSGTVDYAYFGLKINADKSKEGVLRGTLRPYDNNTYDLGSSSYQWNNLYAKNYYYNGVAWGLDKANQWLNEQTCKSNNPKWINQNNNITIGVAPASNQTCAFYNYDKGGNEIGRLISRVQPDGKTITWISATNLYKNGAIDPTGSSVWANLYCAVDANGYPHVSTDCDLTPNVNNTYNLGTSTNKWKTLNGVNPGALSLPKIVAKTTADISSAIVGTDGETQYLDGTDNFYTAALDGWISMCIGGFTQSNELWITVYDANNETWGTSAESSTSARNNLFIIFPIRANQRMRFRMKCNSVAYARFYPCQGNV